MLRKTLVVLLVPTETLLHAPLQPAIDILLIAALIGIKPFEHTEVCVMLDYLGIDGTVGTLAEGKEIHSIKEISLALAVMPDEAVYARTKVKRGFGNILVTDDGNFL